MPNRPRPRLPEHEDPRRAHARCLRPVRGRSGDERLGLRGLLGRNCCAPGATRQCGPRRVRRGSRGPDGRRHRLRADRPHGDRRPKDERGTGRVRDGHQCRTARHGGEDGRRPCAGRARGRRQPAARRNGRQRGRHRAGDVRCFSCPSPGPRVGYERRPCLSSWHAHRAGHDRSLGRSDLQGHPHLRHNRPKNVRHLVSDDRTARRGPRRLADHHPPLCRSPNMPQAFDLVANGHAGKIVLLPQEG